MKRLRDQHDSTDPAMARAAALLSRVERTDDSPARMRRIRRAMDRPARRYAWWRLRPLAIVGLVMGFAVTAAAAYGVVHVVGGLTEQFRNSTSSTQDSPPVGVNPPAAGSGAYAFSTEGPESVIVAPPGDPEPAGDFVPQPRAGYASGSTRDGEPGSPASRSPASPSSQRHAASEARIVQQGLEALRKHDDPKQAAVYLERYRKEHPTGTLAEEALALSVEAASVSGDTRAKELAIEYLSRYPQGRFKEAARHALAKALAAQPGSKKRHLEKRLPSQHQQGLIP